jgi:hypothetical protein
VNYALRSYRRSLPPPALSRCMPRRQGLSRRFWRAGWLVLGIANAALYLSAELQWATIAGRPMPAIELWTRSAAAASAYPFDGKLREDVHRLHLQLRGVDLNAMVSTNLTWRW